MNREVIRKIELDVFDNRTGLEMGLAIVNLAKERNQQIAVQIDRLNHTVFLYVDNNLTADKSNWLRRKANVAKRFEESSLGVKLDLANENMALEGTFALENSDYLAKGGSIPIFIKNAGMIAIVTVSGLSDQEDHDLIVDAFKGRFIR